MYEGSGQHTCLKLLQQRFPKEAIIQAFEAEYGVGIPCAQEKFAALLNESLVFSPPPAWLKSLTKSIVDLIELSGESCMDELVELAMTSSREVRGSSEVAQQAEHAIYNVGANDIAIRKMRMHNEVGTKIWTAGMFLSEFCVQHSDMFKSANVVELGAGVGITGLTLAASESPPERIIMTDFSRDTMENLHYNVSINSEAIDDLTAVTVKELEWTSCTHATAIQSFLDIDPSQIDVILAADCVYSPDLCLQLTCAVENLLVSARGNGCDRRRADTTEIPPFVVTDYPFALIASTMRDPDTFDVFMKALEDSALTYTDVTSWAQEHTESGKFFVPVVGSHKDVVKLHCLQYVPSH